MRYGCVYPCMRYCFIKINNIWKNVKKCKKYEVTLKCGGKK